MTPLGQRMIDAMIQRGFAQRTQETYVGAICRMAKHYRRDPAQYTVQEVQAYLLRMVKDEKLSYSSMNQAACAMQFLFQTVLGHTREHFQVPFAKVPIQRPELLAREEIARLFAACSHPMRRMLLQTMYAAGLRVSEVCALRVGDIDSHSDRMCIRVACGKGGSALASVRRSRHGGAPGAGASMTGGDAKSRCAAPPGWRRGWCCALGRWLHVRPAGAASRVVAGCVDLSKQCRGCGHKCLFPGHNLTERVG